MTLNEALARNRMFWATYIKKFPNRLILIDTKIKLFREMFPYLEKKGHPHCFACHYNMERPNSDYCFDRCIIPWPNGHGCTGVKSPYFKRDAKGILKLIDKAIKKYDVKALAKERKKYQKKLFKNIIRKIHGGS